MDIFKAIPLGAFLTWLVCLFIGSAGSTGGHLYIEFVTIADYGFHWSWPLFLASSALAFVLFTMMK